MSCRFFFFNPARRWLRKLHGSWYRLKNIWNVIYTTRDWLKEMTDNLLKCIPFILPTKSSPTCYCSKGTGLASRRLLSPVSHSSRQGGCGCEEDFCRAESGITGFGLLVSGAHERLFTWRNSATHTLNLISYGIRVL